MTRSDRPHVRAVLSLAVALTLTGCVSPFAPATRPAPAPQASAADPALLRVDGADTVSRYAPSDATPLERAALVRWTAARNEWVDAYVRIPASGEARTLALTALTDPAGNRIDLSRVRAYRAAMLPVESRSVAAVRDRGPVRPGEGASLVRALVPLEAVATGPRRPGTDRPAGSSGPGADADAPPRAGDVVGRPAVNGNADFGPEAGTAGPEGWVVPPGTDVIYLEARAPLDTPPGTYSATLTLLTPSRGFGLLATPERRLEGAVVLAVEDLALSDTPAFSLYGEVPFEDLARLFPRPLADVDPRLLSRSDPRHLLATERLDQVVRLAREHRVDVGFTRLQPVVKNTPREGLRVDFSDYDSLVLPWLTGEIDPSGEGLTAFPMPVADAVTSGAVPIDQYLAAVVSHFEQRRVLGKLLLPAGVPESAVAALPPDLAAKLRRPAETVAPPTASESGVRHVAWTAFAEGRDAGLAGVVTPDTASPKSPGDPTRAAWFYPGSWFGSPRAVVPGVAVKWARRAQQDREIFELARRRGAGVLAQTLARRATRFGVPPPPVGADLLVPAVHASSTWDEALEIARTAAAARTPGAAPPADIEARATEEQFAAERWASALATPLVLPESARFAVEAGRVTVRVELALADPGSEAAVVRLPDGWTDVTPRRRDGGMTLTATLDPARLRYPVDAPTDARGQVLPPNGSLVVEAVTDPNRTRSERELRLPGALVLPARDRPVLDGQLADWADSDLVAAGPLLRMLDRATVRSQVLPMFRGGESRYTLPSDSAVLSPDGTRVLARWEAGTLFLAFRATDVDPRAGQGGATNFAPEALGRAYGQDLVRITLRDLGRPDAVPLRMLVKPTGVTTESAPAGPAVTPPLSASTFADGTWRCEISIPAAMLGSASLTPGTALAFQLTRHSARTGESSSLAGPVDTDAQPMAGLLYLTDKPPQR